MQKVLLTLAIIVFLVPRTSLAACPSAKVSELRSLDPISSHYTQKLLDRIEAGLNYTPPNASTGDGFLDSIFAVIWNWYVKNAVNDTVNVYQTDVLQSRNLEEVTACLHTDVLIVEAAMEEVRCKLNDAYAAGDGQKIIILRSVLHFAEDGLQALVTGATDPFYEHTEWGRLQFWDDDTNVYCRMPQRVGAGFCKNCCQLTTKEECINNGGSAYYSEFGLQTCVADGGTIPDGEPKVEPGLCPFTSDYLPPVTVGYGCDTDTIKKIIDQAPSLDPISREYEGLEQLVADRDAFIENAQPIKDQRIKIDEFMNKEPPDLSKFGLGHSDERPHKQISGCIDINGQGPTVTTTSATGAVSTGTAGTGSTTNTGAITLNPLYTEGATALEPRGTFWFGRDEPKLARAFIEKAIRTERLREVPDYLKNEYELKDQGSTLLNIADALSGMMNEAMRFMLRPAVEQTSIDQAKKRASTFGYTADNLLQLKEVYGDLRETMKNLTKQENDMRTFGTNLAWYLRRSCIHRPCNVTLDRVLKILLTDECFPYTDGSYKGTNAYETCKTEAGL